MESKREIMRDLAITHLEGEGEWCLSNECHVGEDDE